MAPIETRHRRDNHSDHPSRGFHHYPQRQPKRHASMETQSATANPIRIHYGQTAPAQNYASIFVATFPATSVSRNGRPPYMNVSRSCCSPIKCSIVACMSLMCIRSSTA